MKMDFPIEKTVTSRNSVRWYQERPISKQENVKAEVKHAMTSMLAVFLTPLFCIAMRITFAFKFYSSFQF